MSSSREPSLPAPSLSNADLCPSCGRLARSFVMGRCEHCRVPRVGEHLGPRLHPPEPLVPTQKTSVHGEVPGV